MQHSGAERANDGADAGVHAAHLARLTWLGDEKFAHLENRNQAFEMAVVIDHGQGTHVIFIDQLQCFGAGAVFCDRAHFGVHDTFYARCDIANETGQGHVEAL